MVLRFSVRNNIESVRFPPPIAGIGFVTKIYSSNKRLKFVLTISTALLYQFIQSLLVELRVMKSESKFTLGIVYLNSTIIYIKSLNKLQ